MNPWVLIGLAALVGYVALSPSTASAASSQGTGNYWPPTSADTAALSAEIVGYATNALGYAPTSDAVTVLNGILAGDAQSQYIAQLPSGTKPTVAGYRTWALGVYTNYLTTEGIAPNTDPNAGAYGGNPYTASTSGPLALAPNARRYDPMGGIGYGW